jgi:hypothetical protein
MRALVDEKDLFYLFTARSYGGDQRGQVGDAALGGPGAGSDRRLLNSS